MSKRLFHILLIVCILVMASAATAAGQADDVPTITSFATTVSRVDSAQLLAGTARVPVSWVSINRPITANLVFEQVLPDGSVENVELPRDISWVSSSGSGVVAPKWPGEGETEVVLQVRLVDTETDEVLDKREITVEIAPGAGDAPYIADFSTSNPTTNVLQLTAGSARIPVTWSTVNRPLTANLVFEQVMPDGSAANVELPRDNPWVNSSGAGVVAPEYPGEGVDYLTIRLRLFDLITSEEYDRATFRVDILPEAEPVITTFTTTMTAVDRGRLSQRIERVPVSWAVDDRPPNSNLAFEQVMPDDTVRNVELPRTNPWVNSAGNGLAAPYAPDDADEIVLQVRLFDLTTDFVYDTRQITLPIEDVGGTGNIATFNTSATSVNAAQLAAHTARVPVSWVVDSRPSNSNLVFEQVLDDGTIVNVELPRDILVVPSIGQGIAAPYLPGGDATEIHLQLRLIDLNTEAEYDKAEITLPIEGGVAPPRITSFEVSTTALKVSELQAETARVPCTWTVENRPSNTNLVFEQRLPGAEVVNVELPRTNPIVPSTGVGTMAPVYPGDGEDTVVFRLRLVDLSTDVTLHFREVSLPIVDDTGEEPPPDADMAITSFTVTPDVAAPDDVVTIVWETENADSVELLIGETPVEAPELSGSISRTGSELSAEPAEVLITLRAIDADDPDNPVVETRTVTVQLPADQEPQIVNFSAEPTSAAPGETVTLNWETLNAASVALSWAQEGADTFSPESALTVTGSFAYAIPDDATGSVTFTLTATGEDGSTVAQNVTVEVTAPAGEGDTGDGDGDDTGDDAGDGDTGDDTGGEGDTGDDAGGDGGDEGEGEPLGEEDGA
jgi:hypothetical protein